MRLPDPTTLIVLGALIVFSTAGIALAAHLVRQHHDQAYLATAERPRHERRAELRQSAKDAAGALILGALGLICLLLLGAWGR